MVSKNTKSIIFLILIIICLSSCQSAPKTADVVLETIQILPLRQGAIAYVFADVQDAMPIISMLPVEGWLSDGYVKQMVDRTDFAMVAIFPYESGQSLQLAGWGNYPNSRARTLFRVSKNWKRQRSESGQTFWHSTPYRSSLAMSSRQVFVAVAIEDKPIDPFETGAVIPDGFTDFRRGAPLSCWVENPAPMLSRALSQAGIPLRFPVQQLFVNLFKMNEDEFEAEIRLQFQNVSQARGMYTLLNLAGGFLADDHDSVIAALFLANTPVFNRNNVDLRTAPLSEIEVKQLLDMFF